jgi:hypothetical protein
VLVVTEGLLVYLTPEQVGTLARDLHTPSTFQWWLIDLASPRLLAMMQRMWGKNLNAGKAPFQFAPAEGTQFFDKLGWEETEFRSSMEEAHRLKREMSMMWLWRFLGKMRSQAVQKEFHRMSGIVLLKRFWHRLKPAAKFEGPNPFVVSNVYMSAPRDRPHVASVAHHQRRAIFFVARGRASSTTSCAYVDRRR